MSCLQTTLKQAERLYDTVYDIEKMTEETSEDSELLFAVGEICDALRARIQELGE